MPFASQPRSLPDVAARDEAPVQEVQTFEDPDEEEEPPDFEAIAELDSSGG